VIFDRKVLLGVLLLAPTCVAAMATPIERPAPQHLDSAYDRFKDRRTVSTNAEHAVLVSDKGVLLVAQFSCVGDTVVKPDSVRLVFMGSTDFLDSADNLVFLADGNRVRVPTLKHEHDIGRGPSEPIRSISAYLSAGEFVRIARATQVEGQLGAIEFTVPSEMFESLQALATLIQSLPMKTVVMANPPRQNHRTVK
jgi:hypothetical protein